MSSAVKSLRASDISIVPYKVNKQFTYESSSLYENDIIVYKGYYDSGSAIEDLLQEQLNYFSARQLYYSGFITSSISNSSGSYYYNFEQSTAASGTFEYELREFPTEQRSEIRIISIPQLLFGERLKPKHFILESSTDNYYIVDDGNGNLYDIINLGKPYVVDGYVVEDYFADVDLQDVPFVGNVFYAHGLAIITNPDYLYIFPKDCTLSSATAYYEPNDCTATGLFAYYIPPSPTPSVTPSISITPSITVSISISATPSITPSVTRTATPSVTPSVTATPSVTPSTSFNQSVTPSPTPTRSVSRTPSATPTLFTFLGTVNRYTTEMLACANFNSGRSYFTSVNNPDVGDIIYNTTALNPGNAFNGNGQWISMARVAPTPGSAVAYLVDFDGTILSIAFC
jgi:hypothetical protein